jgi:hypothetical protein
MGAQITIAILHKYFAKSAAMNAVISNSDEREVQRGKDGIAFLTKYLNLNTPERETF